MSPSPEYEIVKGNIGYLIEDYLLGQGVDFVATGSFSQEREAVVSVQADESYCFGEKKPIPDLAIEVVFTSGGPDKLKRYAALGVAEVWFWEAGRKGFIGCSLAAISQRAKASMYRVLI